MDQVSRPLLAALLAVVVLAAAWMTVLRPKAESESAGAPLPTATAPVTPATAAATTARPASSAPGVKGLTRAIDKAKGASQASDATNAATQAADPEKQAPAKTASTPATSAAAAKPAATPAVVPAKTPATPAPAPRPALAANKIVLLFAGSGADDAVARQVVRSVHHRGVRTIIATLKQAGKYRHLIGDVHIEIAPTIVVIGRDRQARRIAGLPDVGQLRAALALAR